METTTTPAAELRPSADAERTIRLCAGAQEEVLLGFALGIPADLVQDIDPHCDEALAYIDTEFPEGPNVGREIATAISDRSWDLALMNAEVTTTGDTDKAPAEALARWEVDANIAELLAERP